MNMSANQTSVYNAMNMSANQTSVHTSMNISANQTSVYTAMGILTNFTLDTFGNISGISTIVDIANNKTPCIQPLADTGGERFIDFMKDPVSCIIIVLCPLGFLLNILTIIATSMIPTGRSVHSKLIISLGMSDILITIGVLIHFGFVIWFGAMNLFQFSVKKALIDFGFHATLNNLLIMAADHYLAIMKPLQYTQIMTSFRGHCIISAIWLSSLVFGVLDFFLTNYNIFEWQYVVTGATIVVFLLIITMYSMIYVEIRTMMFRSRDMVHSEDIHTNKAIITTSFIIITFFLCWMPNVGFNLFLNVKLYNDPDILKDCSVKKLYRNLVMVSIIPMVANTLCDPLIYAARLRMVQLGYRRMYQKLFGWKDIRRVSRSGTMPSRERRDTTVTLINSASFKENELRQFSDENCNEDTKRKRTRARSHSGRSYSDDNANEMVEFRRDSRVDGNKNKDMMYN